MISLQNTAIKHGERHQKWNLGNDLHSLVFNFLPTTKIKRISQATHLFIFIRPNGRRALSQRESPSNVVTLTEKPAGRTSFVASVLCTLAWIIAQLVYGGSSSAGHDLEILFLERIFHGVIQMSRYVLNSWYWEGAQSVQLLCTTLNCRHSFDPSGQLQVMHNEKLSGSGCKHFY